MFASSKNWKVLPMIAAIPLLFTVSAAQAKNPYARADDTWISIDGEVEAVTANAFTLNYGKGTVTVEMDDADRYAEGYSLKKGDEVTVSGIIDDDFYEATSIEASSVYVENLGAYFYASAVDEEDTFVTIGPVVVSDTIFQGTVSSVSDDSFTLDSGKQKLTVNVDEMAYNPLDDKGFQKLKEGDRVSVTGNMDYELFKGRVFDAKSVVTLMDKQETS